MEDKFLTAAEEMRVTHLMKVWQYLYDNKVYNLCDYISEEIGVIKGVVSDSDVLDRVI